jgi:hypothetical protein
MLTLANIPADCEFPQLRDLADMSKLAQKLNQHLGPAFVSGEMQVANCTIDQLHYTPGGVCWFLFMANILDHHHNALGQQTFYGKILDTPRAENLFARNSEQAWLQPQFGPALVYVPEWAMVLWAAPNDPRVPGLSGMADTERILAAMAAAPEKFGLSHPPVAITAEQTKYVPGLRCGYIYHLTLAGGGAAAVYGKGYRSGEGEKAYAMMQKIWESGACQRGRFVLPQPYSYDSELQVIWQEAISGQPIAKIPERMPNLPEVANEIGERLAAFHGAHLQLPLEMTFEFQVEDVRQKIAAIAHAFPDYAESCARIGQKLLAAAAGLGPGPVTPVHASFKCSHIFETKKGITFIDFDGANLGDPGYDVGRFIAHLYKMTIEGKIDPDLAEQTVTNFGISYNRTAAAPLLPERRDWFTASHLLTSQIYKSVKRIKTKSLGKLLKIADQLVS